MLRTIREQSTFANRSAHSANGEAKCTVCKRVLLFVDCTFILRMVFLFAFFFLPYSK